MAQHEKSIDTLETLIETCRDGQNGFREAAENVKDPQLKTFFLEQSQQRARFVGELEGELQRLDPDYKRDEKGSISGRMHRTWMDLKEKLGAGDEGILSSAEAGEDSAKETYEKALQEPLPAHIKGIVRQQAQSILAVHDRVRTLRDQHKAA